VAASSVRKARGIHPTVATPLARTAGLIDAALPLVDDLGKRGGDPVLLDDPGFRLSSPRLSQSQLLSSRAAVVHANIVPFNALVDQTNASNEANICSDRSVTWLRGKSWQGGHRCRCYGALGGN
jgi:hypothetical protein